MLPLLGIQFGYLISATVLVEAIFGWPGIGSYAFDALVALDYEPVMGFVADHDGHVRAGQPRGRPALSGHRPADPAVGRAGMSAGSGTQILTGLVGD